MHAGAQQKAAHAQHAVQVLTALLHVPADPLVSIAQIKCCCAESKATPPAVIGRDEVAQLAAHQGASALRVLTNHHLVADAHQIETVNLDQAQSLHVARLCRYSHWIGYGTIEAAWALEHSRFGLCWKDKMTYALQVA